MTLHLIKLCVGIETVEDLQKWIAYRLGQMREAGRPVEYFHTTRMVPKRREELLDGGSLYWVIKGQVQARQKLLDIRPFTDDAGVKRCRLVLDTDLVPTRGQPKRPFQGWRYLKPGDAPADLRGSEASEDIPPEMRRELMELGLL
ncbi:hypothetical protein GGD81_000546 [Rhodobium orientis]|uniref:Lysophospholipase n=1 Tax=Rhodobium orientis TaxID=34017 RepID=A0A327JHW8_9HYPH|nr:DUF1489 family protein [Rhodobium orientis]MBB4301529.1 hypothetical protein [Rhodobium orientis]MBK5952226.1 hypothetical protein [Rhodobium orientis]RAI24813.1 hypothetical protein CH339_20985 [Rhodobium orientis]